MEIYVVWGFLGSGKTTFINYLLSVFLHNKKVVILENESGKESVDGVLLRSKDFIVKDMKAGCVCCSLRNELPLVIQNIRDDLNPDILLVEPSGIASLEDLMKVPFLKINRIITLVDVANYHILMKLNSAFYKRQFALSPVILLTKVDLVGAGRTQDIVNELTNINPTAYICTNYHGITTQEWEDLFNSQTKRFIPFYENVKATDYKTETILVKEHVSINKIKELFEVFNQNSANVVRAKGFVSVTESRILKIDYVCGKVDIEEMPGDFEIDSCFISVWWTNTEFSSLSCIMDSYF